MYLSYLNSSFAGIAADWQLFLKHSCAESLSEIDEKLIELSTTNIIYPPRELILRALQLSAKDCKVVILGQDPYHGENEANGLSFAVNSNIKIPPSLRNIFKELSLEYSADLSTLNPALLNNWFEQGVMLLNASLTVLKDQANSLAKIGWHDITDKIICQISQSNSGCVFILWGNFARSKATLIDSNKHLILESVHPSPLSANRGFFGCNHFKLANAFLTTRGITPINWL